MQYEYMIIKANFTSELLTQISVLGKDGWKFCAWTSDVTAFQKSWLLERVIM